MAREFQKNCYMVTNRGTMPAMFLGRGADNLMHVIAPSGKEYTYREAEMLSVDEAEQMLYERRVNKVAETYEYTQIAEGRHGKVIRCSDPTRRNSSYTLVFGHGTQTCNCPAFQKSAGRGCKHLDGLALKSAQNSELLAVQNSESLKPQTVRAPRVEISHEDW